MHKFLGQMFVLSLLVFSLKTVAATDFTIDPTSSTISISPSVSFTDFKLTVPFTPQLDTGFGESYNGSHGLDSTLFGTLKAEVNTTTGTISFGGGSSVGVANSGSWYPDQFGDAKVSEPANFGAFFNIGKVLGTAAIAVRSSEFDVSAAGPQALAPAGGGNYSFVSPQDFVLTDGQVAYNGLTGLMKTVLGSDSASIAPAFTTNSTVAAGGLTITPNGISKLTVPVHTTVSGALGTLPVVGNTDASVQIDAVIQAYGLTSNAHTFGNITDLGNLGQDGTRAYGVNNAGDVVGYSHTADGPQHAFLFHNGVMQDLGIVGQNGAANTSVAYAINNLGQVAGSSATPHSNFTTHATLWQGNTQTDLGTLANVPNATSEAFAINDFGKIAGVSQTINGVNHPTLWQNGTVTDLGNPLGTFNGYASGQANAVSILGKVAGTEDVNGNRAFTMTGAVPALLPSLEGLFGHAAALGINAMGNVVGVSSTGTGTEHATFWHNGVTTDLGTLGGNSSQARAINNADWIVGSSFTANGEQHAFLWRSGQLTDLNSLLPSDSGWVLVSAQGINKNDQIVGYGHRVLPNGQQIGGERAFLLDAGSLTISAVPEPSTLVLAGVGALGLLACKLRRRRLSR